MQTEQHTPNPRRVAAGKRAWETFQRKRAEADRPRLAKLTSEQAPEFQAPNDAQPASGNGHDRHAIADAFDMQEARDAAEEHFGLQEAKRALNGNGYAEPDHPVALACAARIVKEALERGELELVYKDGKPVFERLITTVRRERIA